MMSIATAPPPRVRGSQSRSCQVEVIDEVGLLVSVASYPGISSSVRPRFDGAVWPWSW